MRAWFAQNWAKVLAGVTAPLSVAAMLGIVLFAVPAYNRTEQAAESGMAARALQIKVAPASCKRYVANYREGVWSLPDLKLSVEAAPVPCEAAISVLRLNGINPRVPSLPR